LTKPSFQNERTTTPDMPLTRAAALMLATLIGILPVIENRKPVGIATGADTVKPLAMQVAALTYLVEARW
jgi:predicted transcriptional regulator